MLSSTDDVEVRSLLATFNFSISKEDREILIQLNTEKRGADKKLNLDFALSAVQNCGEILKTRSLEFPILFSILYFVDSSELALRHEAISFFKLYLERLDDENDV